MRAGQPQIRSDRDRGFTVLRGKARQAPRVRGPVFPCTVTNMTTGESYEVPARGARKTASRAVQATPARAPRVTEYQGSDADTRPVIAMADIDS